MANVVRILVTAKDEVSSAFDRIQDKATLLSKTDIGKGMLQGAGIAVATAAMNALSNAISGTVDWLGQSINAAREDEANFAKLETTLRANVAGWDGNTAAIEDTIEARMKLGFADDAQRDSLSTLLVATKDVTKALDLQATAMDFARLRGIDLTTASDILAKVYAGNVGALARYGIAVEKGSTATEALAAVQRAAAGQAEDFADTTAGAAEGASIALAELQEDIGEGLLPVVRDLSLWARDDGVPALRDFVDALGFLGSVFGEATEETKAFREEAEATGIFWQITGQQIEGGFERVDGASREAKDALIDFRAGERAAANAADGLTSAAGDLGGELGDMGDEAGDAAAELKKLKRTAEDALDAFLEATMGPAQLKLELRNSKDELGENQKESEQLQRKIERLKEAGKPVGELKDDLRNLRGEILDNKEEAIRATAKLEDLGEVPMGSTEKAVRNLLGPLNSVEQQAWDAYAAVRALMNAGGGPVIRNGFNVGNGQAAGGVNAPYTSRLVGENGPEIVNFGPMGGMVHASAAASGGTGGGGGGPVVVQLVVDGRTLAEVSAPYVTAWQQDRQLVAGR